MVTACSDGPVGLSGNSRKARVALSVFAAVLLCPSWMLTPMLIFSNAA